MWIIGKILKIIFNPITKRDCFIDKSSHLCPGCELTRVEIGRYSYMGSYCFAVNAKIGSFCSIADRCRIGGAEHLMTAVSTNPVFYGGRNVLHKNFSNSQLPKTLQTVIGNDVWLGAGCYIKSGVTISTGAVVGMGSVVTHDIPPYEIWAGNPARFIRKRFDDQTVETLLKSQWWTLDNNCLSRLAVYFDNPQQMLNYIGKI